MESCVVWALGGGSPRSRCAPSRCRASPRRSRPIRECAMPHARGLPPPAAVKAGKRHAKRKALVGSAMEQGGGAIVGCSAIALACGAVVSPSLCAPSRCGGAAGVPHCGSRGRGARRARRGACCAFDCRLDAGDIKSGNLDMLLETTRTLPRFYCDWWLT